MLNSGWEVSVAATHIEKELLHDFFHNCETEPRLIQFISPARLIRLGLVGILSSAMESVQCHPEPSSRNARSMAVKAKCLSKVIQDTRPDLVHAHFGQNGVLAAIALKDTKIPLVVNFHGYDVTSYTRKYGWQMYRKCLRDAILVGHSEFVRLKLLENLGMSSEPVVMGVDTRRFSPRFKRSESWPRPLKFLSVGRLVAGKGHGVAIEAIGVLKTYYPDWDLQLSIVGSGEELGMLESKIRSAGLSDYIKCVGRRSYQDMPDIMKAADILLVCSQRTEAGWEEAFCRVAVEGMACGLGIVATPCGGVPETVEGAGYLAKGFDGAAVAEAIKALIVSETPVSISVRSVKAAEKYDLQKMTNDYLLLSERALASR